MYCRLTLIQMDSVSLIGAFPSHFLTGDPDNSGARVHELSAPLAAAGISILYQSSYMSDFIFVSALSHTL